MLVTMQAAMVEETSDCIFLLLIYSVVCLYECNMQRVSVEKNLPSLRNVLYTVGK